MIFIKFPWKKRRFNVERDITVSVGAQKDKVAPILQVAK
jgi:hypothetical protein